MISVGVKEGRDGVAEDTFSQRLRLARDPLVNIAVPTRRFPPRRGSVVVEYSEFQSKKKELEPVPPPIITLVLERYLETAAKALRCSDSTFKIPSKS